MKVSIQLTDEQLETLCETANVIACECPSYLVGLLRQVKKFRSYTQDCMRQFPEEVGTHEWLSEQALQVERQLIQTLFEFMQREELLNERQEIDLDKLEQRSRQAALRQQKCLASDQQFQSQEALRARE